MRAGVVALLFVAGLSRPGSAETVTTSRFVFISDASSLASSLQQLSANAEEDRATVALELGLGHDDGDRTTVRLTDAREAFNALHAADRPIPDWVAGYFEPTTNLIVLAARPDFDALRADFQAQLRGLLMARAAGDRVPHWFVMGVATPRAESGLSGPAPSLVEAGRADELIPLDALITRFPSRPLDAALAYVESASAVRYIRSRVGPNAWSDIFRRVMEGATWNDAVTHVLGMNPRRWENAWRRSVMKWVITMDVLTDARTLWALSALLALFVFWRVHRRKQLKLRLMAIEERAESARRLLRAPANWADEPRTQKPAPDEETVRAEAADQSEEEAPDEAPKKPTLH